MPSPLHCAAVDLGASSGRVIVGTWENNRLTTTEVHRFANQFRSLAGHDYWDIPGLWYEIQTGLAAARRAFPSLASIGVDSWGVDHVLVNHRGRPVFPTHAYRDPRTQPLLAELESDGAEKIYAQTGIPNVFYNTSLQLQETIRSCPAITQLASRCLLIPDYFNFLLTGRLENELSNASTTQLLDVHSDTWSAEALEHFGIPASWFTQPIHSNTTLGPVRANGELDGINVIAVPSHDTAAAYDAMPAAPDGQDLYLSSGTWSLVGFESHHSILGPDARTSRIANERTGDGQYRPLTNVIGLWLLNETIKEFPSIPKSKTDWRKLLRAAADLPAPAQLLDVADPAFANPASMRAAVDQHLAAHSAKTPDSLAGYVRLTCDSLGLGHAQALHKFQSLTGRTFKRILMVGGGAKNALLCQATANAAGIPVYAYDIEGSATGNLASQLIALGAVADRTAFRAAFTAQLKPSIYKPKP